MFVMLLVALGVLAGFLSGLLGVGGGVVMVPLLALLMGLEQHLAQGISMLVIIPTSIIGIWQLRKKGLIDYSAALYFAVGSIAGSYISGNLVNEIPEDNLRMIFGVFITLVGVRMLVQYYRKRQQRMAK